MRLNVAVTSSGSAPAVAVIKALKKQEQINCRITAMDMDPLSSGNYLSDDASVVPAPDRPGFIDKVLAVCRKRSIKCVIPIIDEELFVFAAAKERFDQEGIKVIVNNADVIRLCKDKTSAYRFCARNNLLFPRVFSASDAPGIKAADYPLIIKPNDGRGSIDTTVIKDRKGLLFFKARRIIQKFIEGPEYTIDIVASPAGDILAAVPRRRLSIKAGMSYKGVTVKSRRLVDYGKKAAKLFGITGPANIQCIVNSGKIYLIEVNPKFAAGLPLTVAAGVNIPLILIKLAYGLKVSKKELEFSDGLYMLRYWQEIFVE